MPIRAILYDMDGVLVDSADAWYEVLEAACVRFGRKPLGRKVFDASFGQGLAADVETFFPDRTLEEIDAFYAADFPTRIGLVRPIEGAAEILETVADLGLGQAIVTNTPRPLAERTLARIGLADRIDFLAASGDAPEKPDPALVHLALAALGLRPRDALYIGDSTTDHAAAAAAGVPFVGFGTPADRTIDALGEIVPLIACREASRATPAAAGQSTG